MHHVSGNQIVVVGACIVADQDPARIALDQVVGNRGVLDAAQVDALAIAVFLVDVGCMGIKSAFGRVLRASTYEHFVERFRDSENFVRARPECLRKLVEGALAYAADLGFDPDPDYHSARMLFGDLDAAGCAQKFEFGKDGKPFYVSGPNDSPARIRSIMNKCCRPAKGGLL